MKTLVFLIACFVAFSVSWEAHGQGQERQWIVKTRVSPSDPMFGDSFMSPGARHRYLRPVMGGKMVLAYGTYDEFRNDPNILWAEPNFKIRIPKFYKQRQDFVEEERGSWGVGKVKAPEAWKLGVTGKGIKIAVIDTGVDYTHPAIAHCVLKDEGFNFVNHTKNAMDDNSHGTHVTGTICGKLIGVAPDAKVIPLKFLDADGSGDLAGALDAINFAIKAKVQIMSNSWGGGPYTQSLFEAIQEAKKAGIIFVAAAGNESNDNDARPAYPASYNLPNVISVAATDLSDNITDFSNYGEKSVHLGAPGFKIFSSVLKHQYAAYSGTSMATPHVSAGAALLLSKGIPADKVREMLMVSGDKANLPVASKARLNAESACQLSPIW